MLLALGDLIHKNEAQSSKNQAHRRLWGCGPQQIKLLKSGTLMICLLTHLFLGFSAIKPKNFSLSGLGPSHLDFDLIRGGNGGGGSSCGCGNINSIRWVLIVQLISVSFSFVVELFRGFLKCC